MCLVSISFDGGQCHSVCQVCVCPSFPGSSTHCSIWEMLSPVLVHTGMTAQPTPPYGTQGWAYGPGLASETTVSPGGSDWLRDAARPQPAGAVKRSPLTWGLLDGGWDVSLNQEVGLLL